MLRSLLGAVRDRLGLRRERSLDVRQLLQWMDGAALGWVLIDRRGRVSHLNQRAERLLDLDVGRLLQGRSLDSLCPDPVLQATVRSARRLDRPQRLEWQVGQEEVDVLAMPGRDGWVALQLQSRRTLEAQLRQQERWVSDVAHELKTPLTALLLVGDSLAAQVNDRNARLVERLQRELLRLQVLVALDPGLTAAYRDIAAAYQLLAWHQSNLHDDPRAALLQVATYAQKCLQAEPGATDCRAMLSTAAR